MLGLFLAQYKQDLLRVISSLRDFFISQILTRIFQRGIQRLIFTFTSECILKSQFAQMILSSIKHCLNQTATDLQILDRKPDSCLEMDKLA